MKINSLLVPMLIIFSTVAYGLQLDIIVKNDTPYVCEIIDIRGNAPSSAVTMKLDTGLRSKFEVITDGAVKCDLAYRCGNAKSGYKNITLHSQLSTHYIYSTPFGQVYSDQTDPGITAMIEDTTNSYALPWTVTILNKTYYYNTTGEIVWSIKIL